MVFLYTQRQAEPVAGQSLDRVTLQTLQVCLLRNLEQTLDLKSQRFIVHLLLYQVQDGEEHLVSVMLRIKSNAVPVQRVEEVTMGNRLRAVAVHGCENSLELQGNVLTIPFPTSCFPPVKYVSYLPGSSEGLQQSVDTAGQVVVGQASHSVTVLCYTEE